MKLLSLIVALLLSGCSTFEFDKLSSTGAKASAFCLEGHGPPMTGEGHVAGMKADKDFKGSITVTPDCGMQLQSE